MCAECGGADLSTLRAHRLRTVMPTEAFCRKGTSLHRIKPSTLSSKGQRDISSWWKTKTWWWTSPQQHQGCYRTNMCHPTMIIYTFSWDHCLGLLMHQYKMNDFNEAISLDTSSRSWLLVPYCNVSAEQGTSKKSQRYQSSAWHRPNWVHQPVKLQTAFFWTSTLPSNYRNSENLQLIFNNTSPVSRGHFHNLLWYYFLCYKVSRPCGVEVFVLPSDLSWQSSTDGLNLHRTAVLHAEAKGRTSRCFLAHLCLLVQV